jgi:hypothetical protein
LSIVNNPAVAGYLFYDEAAFAYNVPSRAPKFRQQPYRGTHEPIVSLEVWQEAQRIKTENTTERRTKATATWRWRAAVRQPIPQRVALGVEVLD